VQRRAQQGAGHEIALVERRVEGLRLEALDARPQRRRGRRPRLRLERADGFDGLHEPAVETLEQALARQQGAVERGGRQALVGIAHAWTLCTGSGYPHPQHTGEPHWRVGA
jgi:hypothetical protein